MRFYFLSQFEEKFEEMNGMEPPPSLPLASSSGSNENAVSEAVNVDSNRNESDPDGLAYQISLDANASQEIVGGMMKIVPSDVDVSIVRTVIFLNMIES